MITIDVVTFRRENVFPLNPGKNFHLEEGEMERAEREGGGERAAIKMHRRVSD